MRSPVHVFGTVCIFCIYAFHTGAMTVLMNKIKGEEGEGEGKKG